MPTSTGVLPVPAYVSRMGSILKAGFGVSHENYQGSPERRLAGGRRSKLGYGRSRPARRRVSISINGKDYVAKDFLRHHQYYGAQNTATRCPYNADAKVIEPDVPDGRLGGGGWRSSYGYTRPQQRAQARIHHSPASRESRQSGQ